MTALNIGSFQPRAQQGMVLLVSLVFLLLLTMIGISSMQNATMQEKMAGNVKLRNESFQVAEAALRVGENAVALSTYSLDTCANVSACAPPSATEYNGVTAAGTGSSGIAWVAAGAGFYGVQKIGTTTNPVNSTCSSATLYRITGIGLSGSSRSVLESIYAKC